jgi:hypothetical protein
MAKNNSNKITDFYSSILDNLSEVTLSNKNISEPDSTVEKEVTEIYSQAKFHRNVLVWFYIGYTILFTFFVLYMVQWQGLERIKLANPNFEIMPEWGMNLLVTGMFVQFIGLLKIVTERVWDFKELLAHHYHLKTGHPLPIESASKDSI